MCFKSGYFCHRVTSGTSQTESMKPQTESNTHHFWALSYSSEAIKHMNPSQNLCWLSFHAKCSSCSQFSSGLIQLKYHLHSNRYPNTSVSLSGLPYKSLPFSLTCKPLEGKDPLYSGSDNDIGIDLFLMM